MKNVKFLVRVMVLVSNSVSNSFTFSKVVGKCTFKHCLINRYFLANYTQTRYLLANWPKLVPLSKLAGKGTLKQIPFSKLA